MQVVEPVSVIEQGGTGIVLDCVRSVRVDWPPSFTVSPWNTLSDQSTYSGVGDPRAIFERSEATYGRQSDRLGPFPNAVLNRSLTLFYVEEVLSVRWRHKPLGSITKSSR